MFFGFVCKLSESICFYKNEHLSKFSKIINHVGDVMFSVIKSSPSPVNPKTIKLEFAAFPLGK